MFTYRRLPILVWCCRYFLFLRLFLPLGLVLRLFSADCALLCRGFDITVTPSAGRKALMGVPESKVCFPIRTRFAIRHANHPLIEPQRISVADFAASVGVYSFLPIRTHKRFTSNVPLNCRPCHEYVTGIVFAIVTLLATYNRMIIRCGLCRAPLIPAGNRRYLIQLLDSVTDNLALSSSV